MSCCFAPNLKNIEDTDGAAPPGFNLVSKIAHGVEAVEHMAGKIYHMLPPQATAALAAEAAKRGIVLPTDNSPRGLAAAAAASGVIPSKYKEYISSIATAANIKMPKHLTADSLLELATTAYHALPEASHSQLSDAVEAHGLVVPKDLSPSGLAEAAQANGLNPKFFAHQLSTIATTCGFKLPAGLTEEVLSAMATEGSMSKIQSQTVKTLIEGAGSKLAAVAASRGIKIPTDSSPTALASAAFASGMVPEEYKDALHAAANFAKIPLPKNISPESLVTLVASAYKALPEANQDQLAAAAEAHHVTIPKDLTSAGLAEAAMASGTNVKFFLHQLATAAATHGLKLPAEMTEDITASEGRAAEVGGPIKAFPPDAGAKIAAVAAARGIKMPIDPTPAGLAAAAAATGMAPDDYVLALRQAAKTAKLKIRKAETRESVVSIVGNAYLALPEASHSSILSAAEAHNISIPQDLSPAGLAEAAKHAGVNGKFFAHQLATAVASQGFKLPASLTESMLTQNSAACESEAELEPELQSQKPEMKSRAPSSVRGTKTRGISRSRQSASAGLDLADVQVPDPDARAASSKTEPASDELIRVLTAAHAETIAAKNELIKSQAALAAAQSETIAAKDELIKSQATLLAALQKQAAAADDKRL